MTAPAAPVIRARTDGDKVYVRWQPVSGATNYDLYVDEVQNPTTLFGNYVVADTAGWYQATFLAYGPTFFRMKAINALAEESAYSNELSFNLTGADQAPRRSWERGRTVGLR